MSHHGAGSGLRLHLRGYPRQRSALRVDFGRAPFRRSCARRPGSSTAGLGGEPACKPSSVPQLASRRRSSICGRRLPDSSCGRPEDWAARPLPPERPVSRTPEPRPPIWPCSEQSLPRFTDLIGRTRSGYVSVALVLASRRTGVTRYPALWSSDFPRAPDRSRALAIVQPTRRGGMVDQATRIANCGQRREQLGRSDRWNAWQQTNAA